MWGVVAAITAGAVALTIASEKLGALVKGKDSSPQPKEGGSKERLHLPSGDGSLKPSQTRFTAPLWRVARSALKRTPK